MICVLLFHAALLIDSTLPTTNAATARVCVISLSLPPCLTEIA